KPYRNDAILEAVHEYGAALHSGTSYVELRQALSQRVLSKKVELSERAPRILGHLAEVKAKLGVTGCFELKGQLEKLEQRVRKFQDGPTDSSEVAELVDL